MYNRSFHRYTLEPDFLQNSPLKHLKVYIIFQNMVSDIIPEKIVSISTVRI